jgi:hypothetical protein
MSSSSSASSSESRDAAERLEKRYLIGPAASREIDYRISWQHLGTGTANEYLSVQGESVFVLNTYNLLTRLTVEGGVRAWDVPVADPIEHVIAVTLIPETDNIYLMTGGAILVLDGATGAQTGKQNLDKIANTAPVLVGPFLIYGSRNGQVIWHSYRIAFQWRGYEVAQSITSPPQYRDGLLFVVGTDGTVNTLDASSAVRRWGKKLLDGVEANPAVSDMAAYVAGLDQHLWAFDLGSGRNLWRYLTESPLRQPPTLVGDRIYQHVPTEGLVCLEAMPNDSPGGVVLWKSPKAVGNVLTQRQDRLICWNSRLRVIEVLDAGGGEIIKRIPVPQVRMLQATSPYDGDLYGTGDDGRVIRLIPRNITPRASS